MNAESRAEDTADRHARTVGPAAVVGFVRGALAGALGAGGVVSFVLLTRDFRSRDALVVVTMAAAGAAVIGAAEAASRRLPSLAARLALFVAGPLAALAALAPPVVLGGLRTGQAPWVLFEDFLAHGPAAFLLLASVGVGTALALVGPPDPVSSYYSGRSWQLALVAGALLAVAWATVERQPCLFPPAAAGFGFAALVVLSIYRLGVIAGRPVTRRLARLLDPELSTPVELERRARQEEELLASGRAWVEARRASDPARRAAGLEAALRHAEAAVELASGAHVREWMRREARCRQVELLLELRRHDEVLRAVADLAEGPAIAAEVLRRQGNPGGAQTAAEALLASDLPRQLRASVHAVIALCELDQGRPFEARAQLGLVREAEQWQQALLACHRASALEAELEARAAAALRPPGVSPSG